MFLTSLTAVGAGLGGTSALLINGAFIKAYGVQGWRYGYYVGGFFSLLTGASIYACADFFLI